MLLVVMDTACQDTWHRHLFPPAWAPVAGWDPEKGQVLEPSPTRQMNHLCSRWSWLGAAASTVSDTIKRTIWYQEGVSRRPGQCNTTKSCHSYYLASPFKGSSIHANSYDAMDKLTYASMDKLGRCSPVQKDERPLQEKKLRTCENETRP